MTCKVSAKAPARHPIKMPPNRLKMLNPASPIGIRSPNRYAAFPIVTPAMIKASIEAARAGEHGLGFAVVATEVSTLSAEIKKLVDTVNANMALLREDASNLNASMETANRMLSHEQEQVKKTTELFGNIKESVNGVIEVQQQIAAAVDTCNETADQIQGDILSAKDGYIGVSETVNQLSGDITRKNQLYENMINLLDQVDPIVEEVQKTHINI